mmetsp:Transcript_8910/g.21333  ORF Transcript_8910/g.21333 Transcript_8910/m.21333 type:complete len:263 (-) Transcript_8910:454-1242(-)
MVCVMRLLAMLMAPLLLDASSRPVKDPADFDFLRSGSKNPMDLSAGKLENLATGISSPPIDFASVSSVRDTFLRFSGSTPESFEPVAQSSRTTNTPGSCGGCKRLCAAGLGTAVTRSGLGASGRSSVPSILKLTWLRISACRPFMTSSTTSRSASNTLFSQLRKSPEPESDGANAAGFRPNSCEVIELTPPYKSSLGLRKKFDCVTECAVEPRTSSRLWLGLLFSLDALHRRESWLDCLDSTYLWRRYVASESQLRCIIMSW